MSRGSFANVMDKIRLMLAGLNSNIEDVARYSITVDDLNALEDKINAAKKEDAMQEKLKADLKTSTERLKEDLDEIEAEYSRFKKLVKIAFSQARWKEFGIDDKR